MSRFPQPHHGLSLETPDHEWVDGVPLGNGFLGVMVWGTGEPLRLSLDRTDLWDLTEVSEFTSEDYTFARMRRWHAEGRIDDLSRLYEEPTSEPRPTRIPAGRLELSLGRLERLELDVAQGLARGRFADGGELELFVSAVEGAGAARAQRRDARGVATRSPDSRVRSGSRGLEPRTAALPEPGAARRPGSRRLRADGRREPALRDRRGLGHSRRAHAPRDRDRFERRRRLADRGRSFTRRARARTRFPPVARRARGLVERLLASLLAPCAERARSSACGTSSSTSSAPRRGAARPPSRSRALGRSTTVACRRGRATTTTTSTRSSPIGPPMPPITPKRQAGFVDWLWNTRQECRAWTERFFGLPGLNVPMTADLKNRQIGGWRQYTHSSTTSAWLAQHFYLHYRYTKDRAFLSERAYPYLAEVATFLEAVTRERDAKGRRTLPLSASPEIHDNKPEAWFPTITNFDNALLRFVFKATSELARELGHDAEAERFRVVESRAPDLALSEDYRLLLAKGHPLPHSHRHHSHLLAIHPLGLLDPQSDDRARRIATASLAEIERLGTREWNGYSFAWIASLWARNGDGRRAERALEIFRSRLRLAQQLARERRLPKARLLGRLGASHDPRG